MPKSLPAYTPARPKSPIAYKGSKDIEQTRYNDDMASALRVVCAAPLLNFSVVDISIATSPTKVEHLLNRPFIGWALVDRTGTGTIRRVDPAAGQEPEDLRTHFYLQSSSAETVRVFIF